MEVLADARATDVVENQVAEKVLGTKSIAPFVDMMSARLRPLAQAALNPLMACIWETAESHAHGFRSLLQNGANILLTAPYPTPSDELFKRASSFQESLEAELKTHYKTEDAGRHPEYRKELLSLLIWKVASWYIPLQKWYIPPWLCTMVFTMV